MYDNFRYKKQDQQIIPPQSLPNYSVQDLLKGKNMEIIVAALLLTGKLKVDSVQLFRGSSAVNVGLVGKYLTNEGNKTNALNEFFNQHGDMTLDDVFDAIRQRMER